MTAHESTDARADASGVGQRRRDFGRTSLLVLLVLLAALGIRARTRTAIPGGAHPLPGGPSIAVFFGGLLLLAGVALLAVMVARLRRRSGDDEDVPVEEPQVTRWARFVGLLLALAIMALGVGIPVAVVILSRGKPHRGGAPPLVPALGQHGSGTPGGGSGLGGLVALAVVVGLVLLGLLVVGYLRRRRRHTAAINPPGFPESEQSPIVTAVLAGTDALAVPADDRAAVIACYAAMERSLADAGAARRSADTPTDLLRRAAATGVVRTDAAGRLTTLFREARFSEHPFTGTHRRAALEALDDLRDDLARSR